MDNINHGLLKYKDIPGAILLDVRDQEDYADGHIPGSINLQLASISDIDDYAPNLETPIFVYCYGGMRSYQAAAILQGMGYHYVTNIGGIDQYKGELAT